MLPPRLALETRQGNPEASLWGQVADAEVSMKQACNFVPWFTRASASLPVSVGLLDQRHPEPQMICLTPAYPPAVQVMARMCPEAGHEGGFWGTSQQQGDAWVSDYSQSF